MNLPESHLPYTDKYFFRGQFILEQEALNPFVRAQVSTRSGPGTLYGIDNAIAAVNKYATLHDSGRVLSLREGSQYAPKETFLLFEARVQDIFTLETAYLGITAEAITIGNGGKQVDENEVQERMAAVVAAAKGKPVSYFGARHWGFSHDARISRAAHEGGATTCSTDIGAATFGSKGIGTIPHALENIFAFYHGAENAVVEATKAFDRHIDNAVPRIALVDYRNKEIEDSLATANALEGRLSGVRVDTCGENIAQGACGTQEEFDQKYGQLDIPEHEKKFWFGTGVTISGVFELRKSLNELQKSDVTYNGKTIQTFLSSGFGNVEKVQAFVHAEEILGLELFHALGVGGVYDSHSTNMDIVGVGERLDAIEDLAKVGRFYRPNSRLELRLGGEQ